MTLRAQLQRDPAGDAGGMSFPSVSPASYFSAMSWDDLSAYIRTHGEGPWPADPDEVPPWRLAHEERARRKGYAIPNYRTRRDFEVAVRAAEVGLVPAIATSTTSQPLHLVVANPQLVQIVSQPTPPTLSVVGNSRRQVAKKDALADLLSMPDGAPSQEFLAKRWQRHKGTVSNWMSEWQARGLVTRDYDGQVTRCKARVPRRAA